MRTLWLIAAQVDEHPTRVRQIVAALVKAGILAASRGAAGGVSLKKPAPEITLYDIQRAVQDGSLLALNLFTPKSEWAGKSRVNLVFEARRCLVGGPASLSPMRAQIDPPLLGSEASQAQA